MCGSFAVVSNIWMVSSRNKEIEIKLQISIAKTRAVSLSGLVLMETYLDFIPSTCIFDSPFQLNIIIHQKYRYVKSFHVCLTLKHNYPSEYAVS